MLSSINPLDIAIDHFKTFREWPGGAWLRADLTVQISLPVIAVIGAVASGLTLTSDGVSLLVTSLSVFVGLLFNLLVLATALKVAEPSSLIYDAARQLSREILINVEFAIAVAFAAILLLLPASASIGADWISYELRETIWRVMSAICVGLVASFVLTLSMILRRMHVMLLQHYKESDGRPKEEALPDSFENGGDAS